MADWLARRIAEAKNDDETQLLRLESDARRVQIVTLHKSKGLEYPLVFLPYVAIGRSHAGPGRYCVVHDAQQGRCLHWCLDKQAPEWQRAETAWKQEQRAEEARLLYVGLTRAKHALWIATGTFYQTERTVLWPLLGDPQAVPAQSGIVFDTAVPPAILPRLTPEQPHSVPPHGPHSVVPCFRIGGCTALPNWRMPKRSLLLMGVAVLPSHSLEGRTNQPGHRMPSNSLCLGAKYPPTPVLPASVLVWHCMKCSSVPISWPGALGVPMSLCLRRNGGVLLQALRGSGYVAEDVEAGIALLTPLVGHTLTSVLPEGVRLCDVPTTERRPEIEFQFVIQATAVDALLALLHDHGLLAAASELRHAASLGRTDDRHDRPHLSPRRTVVTSWITKAIACRITHQRIFLRR